MTTKEKAKHVNVSMSAEDLAKIDEAVAFRKELGEDINRSKFMRDCAISHIEGTIGCPALSNESRELITEAIDSLQQVTARG